MAEDDRSTPGSLDEPTPARVPADRILPVAVDRESAGRLASSLKRRPGHVVVTAPFATTATGLFDMAEPMLGRARVVRLSARLLVESEVARAIAGVTARGLPPPSPAALAAVVEEAQAAGRSIVLLVEDADAVQLDRLGQVRDMLARTPAMRDVVRLVLLGGAPLRRLLATPEAAAFVQDVALHLDVPAPEAMSVRAPAPNAPRRRMPPADDPRRFPNEKLLVLAVGVVLVTGVLLFPIEPTRYPPRPGADGPDASQAVVVPPAPTPTAAEPADGAMATEDVVPVEAGPQASVERAEDAVPAPDPDADRRFRPPVPAGPALQVGAFRDRENAIRLATRLATDLEGVYVDPLGEGDATLHRVRIAIPATPLGQRRLESLLAERGFSGVRVE